MIATELCPWCGSQVSRAKYLEIESRIRAEEKKRFATVENELRLMLQKQFDAKLVQEKSAADKAARAAATAQVVAAIAERDAAAKKLREAEAARKQLEVTVSNRVNEALVAQRATLDKDRDLALLKERSAFSRERESLQKKMKVMEHQLQKKTANELGDGAEIDLYEALRASFLEDRVARIPKGTNGGDILHEVRYKGQLCGSILIDCKHRQGWQDVYVSKLKADQLAAGADHAVLSTCVFPSGHREMCIKGGVILINPARVCYLVEILRKSIIAMHLRGLTEKQKSTKMTQLYAFITSDNYAGRFSESGEIANQILDLDVEEKRAHDIVWKKRGTLARRMTALIRELDADIAAIVEQVDAEPSSERKPPVRSDLDKTEGNGAAWSS